jgi:hypothetical protein
MAPFSAIVVMFCTSPLFAASLQGEAMVSKGQGYQAQVGGEVSPGSMVMVSQGRTAMLSYTDGCVVQLTPMTVYRVGSVSPCTGVSGQQPRQIDFSGRMGQATDGTSGEGLTTGQIVTGAAIATGIGIGIYAVTRKSSSP